MNTLRKQKKFFLMVSTAFFVFTAFKSVERSTLANNADIVNKLTEVRGLTKKLTRQENVKYVKEDFKYIPKNLYSSNKTLVFDIWRYGTNNFIGCYKRY